MSFAHEILIDINDNIYISIHSCHPDLGGSVTTELNVQVNFVLSLSSVRNTNAQSSIVVSEK